MNSDICQKRYIKPAVYMEQKKDYRQLSPCPTATDGLHRSAQEANKVARHDDRKSIVRAWCLYPIRSLSISDGQRRPAGPAGR